MSVRIIAGLVAAIAAAELAAQGPSRLQEYQVEVTGGWAWTETDTTPEVEINQYALGGTYFLQPVSLADHPWNEAAFLEHSAGFNASINYTDFEIASFSADGLLFGGGVLYAEKETPVAAQVNFLIGTLDGDGGVDIDLTNVSSRVGYWAMPNALVGVDFALDEVEMGSAFEVEELRFGAFGKIVHDLEDGRAVNVEARIGVASIDDGATDDDNVELGLLSDYYFTPQYSAGALLNYSFGDASSDEGTTLGVRGSAWFTPQFSLNVAFSTFLADNSNGDDQDTLAVFFAARF